MLNERQNELIILLAIITGFIATLLISKYENFSVLWVLYNIPAYLIMIVHPTWKVAGTITTCILFAKYFIVFTSGSEITGWIVAEMVIASLSNISLFMLVAYFIIKFKYNVVEKLEELEEEIKEENKK